MRAKRTVTLWLYCAPSPRKHFCLSVSLTLKNGIFRCLLFSKFFVLQNCAFCSFRSAFYKSSKVFGLWRLRPQSRTADARCYGIRQNSQHYTLRFSGVQICFQVLVPGKLEAQLRLILNCISSVIRCRFYFDFFPKIGICICYVRLPQGFLRLVQALYITLSTIVLELVVFAFLPPK